MRRRYPPAGGEKEKEREKRNIFQSHRTFFHSLPKRWSTQPSCRRIFDHCTGGGMMGAPCRGSSCETSVEATHYSVHHTHASPLFWTEAVASVRADELVHCCTPNTAAPDPHDLPRRGGPPGVLLLRCTLARHLFYSSHYFFTALLFLSSF